MDKTTAQKQLVSLITEHLSDSIPVTRILTYKPSTNGAVTGRFESSGRVYNFAFNGMDARYKPAMNADSALFSEYFLERFDAAPKVASGKPRALPKCTSKSYTCKGQKGVACIPLTNHCKMANTAIGNERLGKIKSMSKFLAANGEDTTKIEATRAKIVEGRMALAAENRAKRVVKPIKKEPSNAKIDLDLLDDLEPMPVQKKSISSPVNKDTLIKNWLKKFEAFEKGDKSKASVDSKEKDSKGKPIIRTFLGKGSYTVNGKKYPKANVLGSIEVSKDLRGQGIFSELIKEIEKRHPDRPIVIESAGENAIALAKKNGFVEDTHAIANWVKLPKKTAKSVADVEPVKTAKPKKENAKA